MTPIPHPKADRLATEWFAIKPDAKLTCGQCGREFPLSGPLGPSVTCTHCGYRFGETFCQDCLDALARNKAQEPAPVAEEPETDQRCDPPGLDDVIGNPAAVAQIRVALAAHHARQSQVDGRTTKLAFPHTLLVGPAGSGKSTLASIIARECKHKLHEHLGQSLNDPRAMVAALLELKAGDVLYIEEVHGLKKTCMEALYGAMQDRMVSPISSRGAAPPRPVRLPAFTLIGATTDQYRLTDSFKQRFQYQLALKRMTVDELSGAIAQRAARSGVKLEAPAAKLIAERSHGTPRKAVMLLARCVDMALAGDTDIIDPLVVEGACEMAELDSLGLTADARAYLRVLADSAKAVRLNVLAATLAAPPRVVEVEIERDLIYLHLIEKREGGRVLSEAGRAHLRSTKQCA